jgi:hypothetical protein
VDFLLKALAGAVLALMTMALTGFFMWPNATNALAGVTAYGGAHRVALCVAHSHASSSVAGEMIGASDEDCRVARVIFECDRDARRFFVAADIAAGNTGASSLRAIDEALDSAGSEEGKINCDEIGDVPVLRNLNAAELVLSREPESQ